MKNKNYIILIITIIIFIIAFCFGIYVMTTQNTDVKTNDNDNNNNFNNEIVYNQESSAELDLDNKEAGIQAVILEVHSSSLMVMDMHDNSLLNVGMGEQGNIGFEKGQEILIYYNGIILTTAPAQIYNPEKIEIIKKKTNIKIPDEYLEYYNNPTNNMSVSFLELTKTGISFLVKTEIEIVLDNSESYEIFKSGSYKNFDVVTVSKLPKKSDIPVADTIKITPDLENESNEYFVFRYDIEWTDIYGELEPIEERKI